MSEWQPIETAPKDGTEVLLWLGEPWNRAEKMHWYEPWETWLEVDPADPNEERYGTGSLVPTYWAPLPEPPK